MVGYDGGCPDHTIVMEAILVEVVKRKLRDQVVWVINYYVDYSQANNSQRRIVLSPHSFQVTNHRIEGRKIETKGPKFGPRWNGGRGLHIGIWLKWVCLNPTCLWVYCHIHHHWSPFFSKIVKVRQGSSLSRTQAKIAKTHSQNPKLVWNMIPGHWSTSPWPSGRVMSPFGVKKIEINNWHNSFVQSKGAIE